MVQSGGVAPVSCGMLRGMLRPAGRSRSLLCPVGRGSGGVAEVPPSLGMESFKGMTVFKPAAAVSLLSLPMVFQSLAAANNDLVTQAETPFKVSQAAGQGRARVCAAEGKVVSARDVAAGGACTLGRSQGFHLNRNALITFPDARLRAQELWKSS